MLSRHAASVYYGLDQMTILRAINQFFRSLLWKTPHHGTSLYTPSTHACLLGCELYGLHEWATTWFPATELYIYIHTDMSYRGWAIWANNYSICHLTIWSAYTNRAIRIICKNMHVCQVCALFYSLYYHVLRRWAMGYRWASSWSVCPTCVSVQNYDTDRDLRVALPSVWHWLG